MNPVFSGLAKIYSAGARLKNVFYDHDLLSLTSCAAPVVSVGNLTVGGTGKTPVVDFFVRLLNQRDRKVGIVCRSYKASARGPGRVDPSRPDVFGDEACWYARRWPNIPVWAGPNKTATACALAAVERLDLILVDDGFQHRALHRDLDLVLLDATDSLSAYECLPAGRAREPFSGLRRADAVLLTKVNWADEPHVMDLKTRLGTLPIFEFESRLHVAGLPPGNLMAVSGIAKPQGFARALEREVPGRIVREKRFPDHHPYDRGDVEDIAREAESLSVSAVVTTEKDAVKLEPLWNSKIPLKALSLEVQPRASVESIYEFLGRAFR